MEQHVCRGVIGTEIRRPVLALADEHLAGEPHRLDLVNGGVPLTEV